MAFLGKQLKQLASYGYTSTHFLGPVANWGIVLSAVYDGTTKGPDTISPTTTAVLLSYSCVFMRFAAKVTPPNPLLFACHAFNVLAQSTQLYRWNKWHSEQEEIAKTIEQPEEKEALLKKIGPGLPMDKIGMAIAAAAVGVVAGQKVIKPLVSKWTPAAGTTLAKMKDSLLHPVGPFYIHFWAPLFKWSLSISNIMELDRDLNQISLPQQTALATTGLIWAKYSLDIVPKNPSLFLVNFVLGLTGLWHVGRKVRAELVDKNAV